MIDLLSVNRRYRHKQKRRSSTPGILPVEQFMSYVFMVHSVTLPVAQIAQTLRRRTLWSLRVLNDESDSVCGGSYRGHVTRGTVLVFREGTEESNE
jgi:hypothetical protein